MQPGFQTMLSSQSSNHCDKFKETAPLRGLSKASKFAARTSCRIFHPTSSWRQRFVTPFNKLVLGSLEFLQSFNVVTSN